MDDNTVGTLRQINISEGGVPKLPIERAVVEVLGVVGDRHRSSEHGGPDRAVCLFSSDLVEQLRAEGHPIESGSTGENFTVAGLEWSSIVPSVRIRVGQDVVLEVTSYTTPCQNIADSFQERKIARISQKVNPGESRVYARVLETGVVQTGDTVSVANETPVESAAS